MLASFLFEKDYGIDWFLSKSDGLGGRLRTYPEDFIVDELGEPRPGDGYTALKLRHSNWESHSLRLKMQRELGLRDGDITVAGTKDKRAVVTQWFTVRRRAVADLNISDVELLESRPCSYLLRSGEHEGNRFEIRIRETEIEGKEAVDRVKSMIAEVDGDWANFFGIQRFGAYRPITHLMGRALIKEGPEKAVKLYLGSPGITSGEEKRAREMVEDGAAWEDVMEALPPRLGFERMMIRHLCQKPDDYEGALFSLPRNLVRLFVHSYQSYLFNLALSKRLEKGFGLSQPLEGDLIQPPTARLVGGKPRFIPVTKASLPAVTKAIGKGKGWITAFLPGTDLLRAGGEQGEIEEKVLEQEKVTRDDFRIISMPEMASHGTRRPILLEPKGLDVWWDDGLVISFTLRSGSYATTVLREIMKSPGPLSY